MFKTMARPIILLTDFGHHDPYAGILKGVITSISPGSNIIDLTHGVGPQDIRQASFFLSISCSFFPKGSVFCVVVDPGVGSDRKGICIETKDYYFIGPDNGVLWMAAQKNGIKKIIHLTNGKYFLDSVSNTFHGRDIFAPVCACISKGLGDISILGTPLKKCVEMTIPKIQKTDFTLTLTVVHIDGFGNAVLNLEENEFKRFVHNRRFCLVINDIHIRKIYNSYSQAMDNELFLIPSSSSHMEIALKNSSAAGDFGIACLDRAVLEVLDI